MTQIPRAILAVDAGAATTTISVLGRPADRWRILGSISAPAVTDPEALARVLAGRIRLASPELADRVGLADAAALTDLPRLECRTAPAPTLAVLAASRRAAGLLETVAARTPWRVVAASPERQDPREMTDLALRPEVTAVLVGAGEPPGPDERGALEDIAGLVGAVLRRRPELRAVVAGPVASRRSWIENLGSDVSPAIFPAPPLGVRSGPDEALREILEGLLPSTSDARHTSGRAVTSLADVLDRRIELIDIGLEGGLRTVARPGVADDGPAAQTVRSARAALVAHDPDDAGVEAVLAWTTGSLDRHRMGDRLRDLRAEPWVDATGDGARLRLAAARAALAQLVEVTPELSQLPTPDLTILAGGAFTMAPPGAVVLAVSDVVRRTGATQVALDHARLLGPIGTIDDPDERRELLVDLADDLVAPLGSVLVVGGLPTRVRGRAATGWLSLESDDGSVSGRRELATGDLAFVDVPPGQQAHASLEFRDSARFARRARRFSVPVAGGVAGLLVDLRDVPLRLPERRDRRRAALATWGEQVWPADER